MMMMMYIKGVCQEGNNDVALLCFTELGVRQEGNNDDDVEFLFYPMKGVCQEGNKFVTTKPLKGWHITIGGILINRGLVQWLRQGNAVT